ncbi:MAG: pirin family protein [Acidobacteria bacterium]|nr:pirin family protein [Acidobacteriota bacterium]
MVTSNSGELRSIANVVESVATYEGEGFLVHRPFPSRALADIDPFLLLDEMGPVDLGPGEAKGAPDHPHRGFETVTYMLQGRFEHKDSHGHSGSLNPGDVQWMTAGAGVVHSEMPAKEFTRTGGRLHAVQLWVNLPRGDKMMKPRYQEITSDRIPVAQSSDGTVEVKVIAGEALGQRAVIDTRVPITYLHFKLQPGASVEQLVPAGYNCLAYTLEGAGLFGKEQERVERGHLVLFGKDGRAVKIAAPKHNTSASSVLLLSGKPLNEPVARYGPFVMNTQEEVRQAIVDYQHGRMGTITG